VTVLASGGHLSIDGTAEGDVIRVTGVNGAAA
jgi:hypothetical protein